MERSSLPNAAREPRLDPEDFGFPDASEEPRLRDEDLFSAADPRIFLTDPDSPEDARTFVRALTGWFERIEGYTGAVELTPVAQDEEELREWLSEQGLDITELDVDNEFARTVREEFLEQTPLYPEAPELSEQKLPG
jgi:hypothetical protein